MAGKVDVRQTSTNTFIKSVGLITIMLTGLLLVLSVVSSFSPDMIILPLGLLLLLGGLVFLALGPIALYAAIKERKWRALLCLAAALAATVLLAYPVWMMGDYVHFAVSYALHHDSFDDAQARPVSIPWSENGFAGSSCNTYLVHDRSGRRGEGSGPGVITRHLTANFHIRADCY